MHFTPFHTLRQLKRDEALFPPVHNKVTMCARLAVVFCTFECSYSSVLRPILLKLHILTRLIESFPIVYGLWRCIEVKLLIPLETRHKAQLHEIFLSYPAKKRAVIFFFCQSCRNCIIKRPRWRAFKRRTACRLPAKKSCNSHFLWCSQAGLLRWPSRRNYRKP